MKKGNQTEPVRTGLLIVLVVVGMIGLQLAQTRYGSGSSAVPGPSRGDLILEDSLLPRSLEEWTVTSFTPPLPPDRLPRGQKSWTHSWTCACGGVDAIVAFDQADWINWHDLTLCYVTNGWKMNERPTIVNDEEGDEWPFVRATFTGLNGQSATLVYSMLYSDGSPVDPREFDFHTESVTLTDRVTKRLRASHGRFSGRSFQCQVFVPDNRLLDGDDQRAIDLHLMTRRLFQNRTIQWRGTGTQTR
ncbi:MAG: exosortase U [Planctomycetaceae bacterium]